MKRASGILFIAPGKKALFLKRGPGGDHPGEWCFPGGHQEDGESIEDCATREAIEEIGFLPDGARVLWTRTISPSMAAQPLPVGVTAIAPDAPGDTTDFTTFLQPVAEEFVPTINGEHVGYAWAPIDQPPEPLHPGARIALSRFAMDEVGVARAIAAGELASPQRYENVWLFAIRITGTGVAYRHKLKEFVWRDPALYMNEEFIARCNGLAVIMEHPAGAVLDTEEFQNRIVGMIVLPYLKPDAAEVWGIAKIYDAAAAKMMSDDQLSTSPSVVFRDPSVNNQMELEDGSKLLIEGKPSLLDHVAICEQGVWDKGGEPRGVLTAAIGDSVMTEDEKRAAEEKARKDADAKARADADVRRDETLDKVLKGVDSVMSAVDSLTKRMDAAEEKLKEDDDDAKKRGDDASRFSARKDDDDDDAYKKRHDAEEEALSKELKEKGEPEKTAADRAKRGRKDAEEKEAEMMADKKRKADDDARKKADADIRGEIKRVEALIPKPLSDADYKSFADAQERADHVFLAFGDSAPRPMQGEDLLAYRKRLAGKLQDHSTPWKGVDLAKIADDAAFKAMEDQIYTDALRAAERPTNIPKGQLLARVRTDDAGRRITSFIGNESFIQAFKQPTRRVVRLNTDFRDR